MLFPSIKITDFSTFKNSLLPGLLKAGYGMYPGCSWIKDKYNYLVTDYNRPGLLGFVEHEIAKNNHRDILVDISSEYFIRNASIALGKNLDVFILSDLKEDMLVEVINGSRAITYTHHHPDETEELCFKGLHWGSIEDYNIFLENTKNSWYDIVKVSVPCNKTDGNYRMFKWKVIWDKNLEYVEEV